MADATALFSDGLDLLAEFLASSHAADDGISVTYDQPVGWHAAAAELRRWSGASPGSADGITLDQAALRITVTPELWNRLYASALSAGRSVAPDRSGLGTRGVGGMLAELSLFPAMAEMLRGTETALANDDADDQAWLLLPWQPLKALLLRDRLLLQEAMWPRRLLDTPLTAAARYSPDVQRHGLLVQQDGQPVQLFCPPAWGERIRGELRRHFTESVLLLFRLMFYSPGQGWGWDAGSAQCAGLVDLMDDAKRSGLADLGDFADSCALLADLIASDAGTSCDMLMAATVHRAAMLWPAEYLRAGHPACKLMAGWMVQVHPDARIAPDALLGPGVTVGRNSVIGAGAVLQNGAEIGPGQVVPPGVVIAAGAVMARIALSGNVLPPGTLLRGSIRLYRKVSTGKRVTLGADAEIGSGVVIPDGVEVAGGARVTALQLGDDVLLPDGTVIEGNLTAGTGVELGLGVRVGANVVIRPQAIIGDGVCLPPAIVVAARACVLRCTLQKGARIAPTAILCGDLTLGPLAHVGAGVTLGAHAVIGPGVTVPAGVTVRTGAHIRRLELHGCWLPPGTVLGGDLRLGRHCRVGSGIVFEGANHISREIELPDKVRIAQGATIRRLRLANVMMAPGTVLQGDAFVAPGTRIGRGVTLGADVVVTAAVLPDGVTLMPHAVVSRCDVAGAVLPRGVRIGGDMYLAPGVKVGANVLLHRGVRVNCPCRIPDGVEIMPASVINRFDIAPRVALPAGTRIAGNLCLKYGVVVGAGVRLGADVTVERNVRIPDGARLLRGTVLRRLDIAAGVSLPGSFALHGDAVLGAGAGIGEGVILGADVEVGPGVLLPPGVLLMGGARIAALRIADDVVLHAGTTLGGDLVLRRGVQVGRDVVLGAGADIGPHVVLPDGVVVEPGAVVRMLQLADSALLGEGIHIAGDLAVGVDVVVAPGARFGAGVVLEAGCSIGPGIALPAGVIVESGSRLDCVDIAAGVTLPPQTRISGDLCIAHGVLVGRQVCFGHKVRIGPDVAIPDGTTVLDDATVNRLEVAADMVASTGLMLCGDAVVGAGVVIDDNAVLGPGAVVGPGVHLPKGCVVMANATVRAVRLGADVRLPEEFSIAGDLCLEDRVMVGQWAQFGAGVVVGAGAVIGHGAILGDKVLVCAGAVIGDYTHVSPDAVIEAVTDVEPGAQAECARPSADAHVSLWQAYLSPGTAPADAPLPAVEAMPPSSAPVDIPARPILRPVHANVRMPGPHT
jgi:UDP-3-O-[3-hydroxymyristoyl] glucosamine N-acyltransferase